MNEGNRHWTVTQPLNSPQASPVAMGLGEAYGALQQGVVDGQEGLLPLVVAAHFEEVQKYCALTNHSWDGQWICTSANAWKG